MLTLKTFARATLALAVALATAGAFAQTTAQPHSGGLLKARQFLAERGTPAAQADGSTGGTIDLSCSPAPCVLPNVQASAGPQPVNENSITANPVTGVNLITTGNDYNCPTLQGIFASADSGSTWTRTCMSPLPGNGGLGDPVPAYDSTGNAFVVGINSPNGGATGVIVIQKSLNNGLAWQPAVQAVPNTLGGIADKPWMEVDTNATSPFNNSIYVSVTQFSSTSNSRITVSRSRDGGATWALSNASAATTFPDVVQFSDMAVGRDGTVYLAYLRCRANGPTGTCAGTTATMLFQKSTDGGVTWSTPATITTVALAPGPCGAFYGCIPNTSERTANIPVIAVDSSTGRFSGRLYVAMYNYTGGAMKVQVVASSDGGATWGAQQPVAPATAAGDQFFPWLNVSSTGVVGVTWLDRRRDTANRRYEAWAATSGNGGGTYSRNARLSTTLSDPLNDGFGGTFMGDYTGNVWVGKTLFMSYMDTRTGVSQDFVVGGTTR